VPPEAIQLVTPPGRAWHPVVRLVLGGVADRLGLGFEELDDLQLAVERLLVEAGDQETVAVSLEIGDHAVRLRIGPLRERAIAAALQAEPEPGELNLRRILEAVVDSFGVEEAEDGELVVRLEKLVKGHQ
jgi:hypothetical protein